jgi:tripartite-type tricarboxylate transporter receptor subunit TctC
MRKLLVVIAALCWPMAAGAQYPSKPVRIIVPFTTGAPDTVARLVGQQLAAQIGKPFVVENRPGANGVVGADSVAKAAPDGYMLLVTSASFAINPSIYRKLPFDVLKDFTPISLLCATEALILGVNPDLPARTPKELVDLARRTKDKLSFSSAGIGNGQHLAAELFKARAGVDMVHVPYKGAGPALTALVSGEVQVMFMTPPLSLPYIEAGTIRAIGYTGTTRAKFLPDVPTLIEAGIPDMVTDGGWYGIFAPPRTPAEIVGKLHAEIKAALAAPLVHDRLGVLGLDPIGNTPAEFASFIGAKVAAYAEMVKLAGIEPE